MTRLWIGKSDRRCACCEHDERSHGCMTGCAECPAESRCGEFQEKLDARLAPAPAKATGQLISERLEEIRAEHQAPSPGELGALRHVVSCLAQALDERFGPG